MKRLLIVLILALVFSSIALAQNFSGKYVLESGEGDTVLSVQQDAQGKVQGTLEFDDGTTFQLRGEIKNNEAIGIASNQANTNLFKLRFQGGQLIYTIIAIGPDGNPDLANVQEFPFTRQGGGEAPGRAGPMTAAPAAPGTAASGHSFAGTYSVSTSSGPMRLSLQQHGEGRVTGTMTDTSGGKYNLDGAINDASGMVMGILVAPNGTQAMFKVQPMANGVSFAFTPMGGDKNASLENAQVFPFTRTGGAPAGGMPPSAGGGNPLAGGTGSAAGDPLTGTFTDGNMHLQLQGGGGQYQGQIQFQGQAFPVTAQSPDGRTLTGRFTSGTNSFDFTGSLQGSTLNFNTGGTNYQLRRQGGGQAPAANPLGGGAGPASAATQRPIAQRPVQQQAAGGATDGIQRHQMAPATPGRLSDNNPQSVEWLNHLRGKLLSRLSSYTSGTAGGYSSNERMLLYPNGQFEHYSASSVSVQAEGPVYSAGGSSGGQGTRRGTWRIVTAQGTSFLALVYEGSMQEEYTVLDFRENKTFIDGSRVFVTAPQ